VQGCIEIDTPCDSREFFDGNEIFLDLSDGKKRGEEFENLLEYYRRQISELLPSRHYDVIEG
jgi:hypothetical protein